MSWTIPSDTGGIGITIDSYKIFIYDYGENALHPAPGCDGTDSTVVLSQSCEVEMSSLLVHPFTLLQGDDIKAVVIAVNTIGEGQ